jgi:hypothetical protein
MTAVEILVIGIIATGITDVWQQMLKQVAGVPGANWSLVGRWIAGIVTGRFYRPTIATDPAVAFETPIGWVFHYFVGVVYATMFVALDTAFDGGFGLIEASGFGLATLIAPFLLLKPAMGLGPFANRAPDQLIEIIVTTMTHLAFGFGLYTGSTLVAAI